MTNVRRTIQIGIMALAIMCGAAGHGFAGLQDDQEIDAVVATMQQMLKLTNAQAQEVKSVVREYFRNVEEARSEGISGEDLKHEIKDLHDEMDAGLENYLTGEQMALWKKQTSKSTEAAGTRPARKNSVSSAGQRHLSTGKPRVQDNNGVLVSGSTDTTNTTKTSGVW